MLERGTRNIRRMLPVSSTMIRRLGLILVSLTLGALSTVAVAWGFAWKQVWLSQPEPNNPEVPRLIVAMPSGAVPASHEGGKVSVECARFPGTALWQVIWYEPSWMPKNLETRGDPDPPGWVLDRALFWESGEKRSDRLPSGEVLLARGWPVPTMWSVAPRRRAGGMVEGGAFYFTGPLKRFAPRRDLSILPMAASFDVPFPLRPIWMPFLISSAVFASGWWCIIRTPGWIRRGLRRKRNLCAGCGYSRAGIDRAIACPECGRTEPDAKPLRHPRGASGSPPAPPATRSR